MQRFTVGAIANARYRCSSRGSHGSHPHSNTGTNRHGHTHAGYRRNGRGSHGSHSRREADGYGYTQSDRYAHTDRYAYAHTDRYAYAQTNGYAYAQTDRYAYSQTNPNTTANQHPYTNTDHWYMEREVGNPNFIHRRIRRVRVWILCC